MWVFQQFGNLIVAFVLVLIVAIALRRPKVALGAVMAVVLKLVGERIVKSVVKRSRPAVTIGRVIRRGAVPRRGFSFVSGHAVITTALATIVTPVLPRRWKPVPWVIVALNGVARIYVGAHNPLDIVGGIGLGLLIGGLINALLMPRPRRSRRDVERRPLAVTGA
jgi:undecaprenyl-diphosphatase